jgi:DNA-binding CsgD family transcriptional regulator
VSGYHRESTLASDELTEREREVLALYAEGMNGAQAATALFLSHQTIRTHTKGARGKLRAHTTTHAVAIALRRGLIQ